MLSAIIVCDAGLSVLIMRVVYKFNSLFVLIEHEYQVLPTVKLPKYCSDVTGAQVHRHTGDDWRDDGREKMRGERRSTCRMTVDDEEEVTRCSRLRRSCVSKDSEEEDDEELPSRHRLAHTHTHTHSCVHTDTCKHAYRERERHTHTHAHVHKLLVYQTFSYEALRCKCQRA